jgi:hypothetical protein
MKPMTRRTSKTWFWLILAIVNIAAMIYPVGLYAQADGNESQFSAIVVVVGVAFLLAIVDAVSGMLAYMN